MSTGFAIALFVVGCLMVLAPMCACGYLAYRDLRQSQESAASV